MCKVHNNFLISLHIAWMSSNNKVLARAWTEMHPGEVVECFPTFCFDHGERHDLYAKTSYISWLVPSNTKIAPYQTSRAPVLLMKLHKSFLVLSSEKDILSRWRASPQPLVNIHACFKLHQKLKNDDIMLCSLFQEVFFAIEAIIQPQLNNDVVVAIVVNYLCETYIPFAHAVYSRDKWYVHKSAPVSAKPNIFRMVWQNGQMLIACHEQAKPLLDGCMMGPHIETQDWVFVSSHHVCGFYGFDQ